MRPKHHHYLHSNQQHLSSPDSNQQPQHFPHITPIRDEPTAARILMKIEQSKHRHFSAPSKEISVFQPYPRELEEPNVGTVVQIIKKKESMGLGRQAELEAQLKIVSIENQKLIDVIENNHVNLPSVKEEIMLREIQELRESCQILERERQVQRGQLSQGHTENQRLLKLLLAKDHSSTTLNTNSAQSLPRGEKLTLTLIKEQYQQNIRLARSNFYDEMEHMAHRYDENLKELIKNIDEMERRIERAERDLNCCQNTERSMGGQLKQKQFENQQLTAKLVMYINELDDEREEKEVLRNEIDRLKKQLNRTRQEYQSRQPQRCRDCPFYKQRIAQVRSSNLKLSQELSRIKDELISLQYNFQCKLEASNSKISGLQNHIIFLQNELQLKLQQNSHLFANIANSQQELSAQKREKIAIKADNNILTKQIEHYQLELKEQQSSYYCLLQANELAQKQILLKAKIKIAQQQQQSQQLGELSSQIELILKKHKTRVQTQETAD